MKKDDKIDKKTKVGIICEGSPDSDVLVFEYLIKKINPNIEIVRNPLGNKKDIFRDCAKASKNLFNINKCDKVFIFWDLQPSWITTKPCRKEDREQILESLKNEKIDINKISLICIESMLEAWLIADEKALELFFSKKDVEIDKTRNPEREKDPKAKLIKIFKKNTKYIYEETRNALQIIKLADTQKISRKCSTFKRFEEKIKLV